MSHTLAELDEFRRALRVGDVVRLKKLMGKSEIPFYEINELPYMWDSWKFTLPQIRCVLALWSDLSVEVTQQGDRPRDGVKRHKPLSHDCTPIMEKIQKELAKPILPIHDHMQWTGTLRLLEEFKADPLNTQLRLRAELGFRLDPSVCKPCTCTNGLCCPGYGCQEE